ncbi:RNA-guided endonuclease InsQ/TnpB family protein [Frankia tisae]|uniref:RNA-guided endonuclease InsQ/TnpB family protein n=1 Tax=Frankia tisae TaxID=2950104 RepID=UPI0021C13E55|nr:transposase [Frankia tisae]
MAVGSQPVKRSYRYRFYPDSEQSAQLAATFGCVRYVYNRALAEWSRAWREERRRVTLAETGRMLTGWKRDPETLWLAEPQKGPLQATLRHLQAAFVNFWAQRPGFPSFKRKGRTVDAATYFRNCFTYRDGRAGLAKQGRPLDIVWSRPLPDGAVPSQVTVSRNSRGQYHLSILVEETVTSLPSVDARVGVDAGITALVALSTEEKVTNPKREQRDRVRLARAQRNLAHKVKGSRNRAKARARVARIHGRIADRRRDFLHTLSTRLIRENQTVALEDLPVRNLLRNHTLARAISDASWSELRRMVEYKAGWYGWTVIEVDRFYPSSKTCSSCGAIHDRDVNAAKNILAAGLAVSACGEGVRPPRW